MIYALYIFSIIMCFAGYCYFWWKNGENVRVIDMCILFIFSLIPIINILVLLYIACGDTIVIRGKGRTK